MLMHNPPHPGEILREDVLPTLKMSISDLAEHLGYSRTHFSTVLHGHTAISAEMAVRLEMAGISNGRQWLAMQSAYDLWQAANRDHPAITPLEIP
ncbi:HigA family addiction module antitoxin [Pseudomonas chlororaphis]|uniref:HigA family addiction module antitoxin n=1 Tax=Pseudomonas chlororaphis TaxID=587753 RepID=UPI00087AA58D|nr:HigA family addiction module antitoxin [Pseudomonas chlororaphis]WDG95013.1 HigA family addiction module antitoxin [Pseudomonas chlororaphis]SDS89969.1 addiction module antidote protein, HigA family [Pseudomonas chlororaphis]